MDVLSLFSGAGGLDLGFEKAGFGVKWANDNDPEIWETFQENFPSTGFDKRSIIRIPSEEVPDAVGIIGGPPCQSWSEAGSRRDTGEGMEYNREQGRGQLFLEYIRLLRDKQPLFFLAENVRGILLPRNKTALAFFISLFESAGYNVSYELLDAHDYGVPQNRHRIIVVGYHKSLGKFFQFPEKDSVKPVLRDVLADLTEPAIPLDLNRANDRDSLPVPNHEFMEGGFSSIYMSRNRVRSWDEPSFTIQAGGRHAPLHPKAPKMLPVEVDGEVVKDVKKFVEGSEHLYRRLSVRECARIQTFPDSFIFKYEKISAGYKMIGNAVPVELAKRLANQIMLDLAPHIEQQSREDKIKNGSDNTQSHAPEIQIPFLI